MLSVTSMPPQVEGRASLLVPLYAYRADPKEALASAVREAFHNHRLAEWRKAAGIEGTGAA